MKCPHELNCGGCAWITLPEIEQKNRKLAQIEKLLTSFEQNCTPVFHSIGQFAARTRFDFTIIDGKMGLFSKNEKQKLVEIKNCPQLHPDLEAYYNKIQEIHFPIKKGSVRLRIGKDGLRGIWLDFSNIDIKMLLDQGTTLNQLAEISDVIEIGQKRKTYNKKTGKLSDPKLLPWFATWHQGQKIWLEQYIASFTQSGERANQLITQLISASIDKIKPKQIVEFGSGFGNLTFAAHAPGRIIHGFEFEKSCKEGIEKTLCNYPNINSQEIHITTGDFQNKIPEFPKQTELLLVNPPRSGLKNFVQLAKQESIKHIIYMSCYPESFEADFRQLKSDGFNIMEIDLVDQFPQTDHIEIIAILKRP